MCAIAPSGRALLPEDWTGAIAERSRRKPLPPSLSTIASAAAACRQAGAALDTAVMTNAADLCEEDGKLVCSRTVYGGTAHRKQAFSGAYGVFTFGGGAFEPAADAAAASDVAVMPGAPASSYKRVACTRRKRSASIWQLPSGLSMWAAVSPRKRISRCAVSWLRCSAQRSVALARWLRITNGCPRLLTWASPGVQVKPDLILVLGVSGQVQHIGGINKSKVIVAVNKDKAPPSSRMPTSVWWAIFTRLFPL